MKKKLKESLEKRKFQDRPVWVKLCNILKRYSITPEQYHGGELVGNHSRILMVKPSFIMAEIITMLKGIPIEERRQRDSTSKKITNEEIEQKMNTLTDLLTLADYMCSQCH